MIEKTGSTLYNGVSIYKYGGGGGKGPIFEIPNEFEQVDSIYNQYNTEYLMGVYSGNNGDYNYNTGRILPVKNNGIVKITFWKREIDNIGGNVNYIFGFRGENFASRLNYVSDATVGVVIQHSNLIISNGAGSTSIDRTGLLIGGVNEIELRKDKAIINGIEKNITYSERTLYYVNGLCYRGSSYGTNLDGTTLNDPSAAFISLYVEDEDNKKLAIVAARRKADGEIGFLDCSSLSFIRNNDNQALAVKSFT